MTDFFALLDQLVGSSTLIVDRRRGKPHPRISDAIYPLDYGHLGNTTSGDGAEIDVFIGSASGRGVVGALLTADLGKRDAEIKVLLDCTGDEVQRARQFLADVLKIGGHLVERPGTDL